MNLMILLSELEVNDLDLLIDQQAFIEWTHTYTHTSQNAASHALPQIKETTDKEQNPSPSSNALSLAVMAYTCMN